MAENNQFYIDHSGKSCFGKIEADQTIIEASQELIQEVQLKQLTADQNSNGISQETNHVANTPLI